MTLRMLSYHVGPSRFLYTLDRGRSWRGPYKLPNLGFPGIAARTDYLVGGRHELLAFLTAAKSNRRQGRVICARTTDGGGSWELLGEIGPELDGVNDRLTEGEMRMMVVNAKKNYPDTIMPGFHNTTGLHRVGFGCDGKAMLTAQQVEDVIAVLKTLK